MSPPVANAIEINWKKRYLNFGAMIVAPIQLRQLGFDPHQSLTARKIQILKGIDVIGSFDKRLPLLIGPFEVI